MDFSQPLALTAQNFTPLARTPWAGQDIALRYKFSQVPQSEMIGESWEVSCEPDFPSRILNSGDLLSDVIARSPQEMLSSRLATRGCDVLVKLLSATLPLSLQVHPSDLDEHLAADECGKPESWLILNCQPGSGIYLGFQDAISPAKLRDLLASGQDCRSLLSFVPVEPGDYFDIEPGVPHAVGAGITLLEPQRVIPNKKGKTYRMWDWGRRYGIDGTIDQINGSPRELHLDEALAIVNPQTQIGREFVQSLRRYPRMQRWPTGGSCAHYPDNDYFGVIMVRTVANESLSIRFQDGYLMVIPLEGGFTSNSRAVFEVGQPYFVPAALREWHGTASQDSLFAIVYPSGTKIDTNHG